MHLSFCHVLVSIGIGGSKQYIEFGDRFLQKYGEVDFYDEVKYPICLCFFNL